MRARPTVLIVVWLGVLVMAGTTQAESITWTGNVDNNWDATTLNWNDSGGNPVTYQDGDDVLIDVGGTTILMNLPHMDPSSVLIDVASNLTFQWKAGGFTWGGAAFGSGTITKRGTGTWRWYDQGGYWEPYGGAWSGSVTAIYNIEEGVWRYDQRHEGVSDVLGGGATVNLKGGDLYYNEDWRYSWQGATTFNVTADSNLRVTAPSSSGWATSDITVSVDSGATLTMIAGNGTMYWANVFETDLVDNTAGTITVEGDFNLNAGATLTVNVSGTQALTDYVLIDYTGYSQSGTFATVNVPAEYGVDYAYNGGTQIALVPFSPPTRDSNYIYWSVDGDGDWTVNANWDTNSGYPNAAGVKVRFDLASLVQLDANTKTITLNAGETVTIGELEVLKPGYTITGDPTSTLVWAGASPARLTLKQDAAIFADAGQQTRLDSNLIIDNQVTRGYTIDLHTGGSGWDSNGHDIIIQSAFGGSTNNLPEVILKDAPADSNVVVDFSVRGWFELTGDRPNTLTLLNNASVHTYLTHMHTVSNLKEMIVRDGARLIYGPGGQSGAKTAITITGNGWGNGALDFPYNADTYSFDTSVSLDGNATITISRNSVVRIQGGLNGEGDLTLRRSSAYSGSPGTLRLEDPGALIGDVSIEESRLVVANSSGTATGTGTVTIDADSLLGGDGSVDNLVLAGQLRPGQVQSSWDSIATYKETGRLGASDATFLEGASYLWELKDAASTAGIGWDLLNLSGALTFTDANWTLDVDTLSASDTPGDAGDFNPGASHVWQVIAATSVTGFDANNVTLDVSGFTNTGTPASPFAVTSDTNGVYLTYTAEMLLAVADANWNVAGTWDVNMAPTWISGVEANDHTVTVANPGAVAMAVTVDAGDHLKINSGADLTIGYQLDVTGGGILTVDGALTSPTGTANIASTLAVGATGSLSAKNVVFSSNNTITAGTVTATNSFQVTNSSSLDMTGSELDVSTASVAIDTGSTLTVDQSTLAVGGALTVDGDLVLDGTTLQTNGAVTIGGTIAVNLSGTSGGLDLGADAELNFIGSSIDIVFGGAGGGDYYGLRWAGNHGTELSGWLNAGTYTGNGKITASAPGSLDINDIKVGYDGNFTYIGFGSFPVYAGPTTLATLTFDDPGTDIGYTQTGGSVTSNGDQLDAPDGNCWFVSFPDSPAQLTLAPVDATGYSGLQLTISFAADSGFENEGPNLDFIAIYVDANDGNGFVQTEYILPTGLNTLAWFEIDGVEANQIWQDFAFDLPSWADNSDALRIRIEAHTSSLTEDLGFDTIRLIGIPEPTSAMLLLAGTAGLIRRRRMG